MRPLDQGVLRSGFAEVVRENNLFGLRVATILGFTFVPLFGILDYILSPEDYQTLWALRLAATISSVGIFIATYRPFGRRYTGPLSTIAVLNVSASIAAMIRFLGGYESEYYAGLCLLIIVGGLLFTWSVAQSLLTNLLVVAMFELPAVFLDTIDNLQTFTSNSFFLTTTAIVIVIGHFFNRRLKFREYANSQLVLAAKRDLEQAHEQLKQLDRFKSQVFANVTHELKTPLNMILSPLELLQDGHLGPVSEEQRATFASMFRSGMKLLKLIGDILDLSKLEESRIRLNVAEHDLVAYMRGLVAQVQPLAQRKRIALSFGSDVESAAVWCDLERLERVFINLLSNAAKFTPEDGRIRVTLHDEGASVLVSVADNGPGFPAGLAEKVFERFVQADMGATRRYGGTGIGLALARELVELHGGRIWAESDVGRGATFHVRLIKDREHFNPDAIERRAQRRDLPDGRRAEDRGIVDWTQELAARDDYRLLDIAEVTERRVVERDADEARRAWTVLVVEDTPDVIRLVHLSLRQQFRILAAENGAKGIELALRETPDLIITDLMMPEMDGLEMTRRLREDPRTRRIPIIMLTARGDLDDRLAGLETGVNHYLTKPFSPRELVTTVRSLLQIEETHADLLLTQRMDSLDQVAGGLAHEINNPLNYLKNALALMKTDAEEAARIAEQATGRDATPGEIERLARLRTRIAKMSDTAEAGVRRIARTVELMRSYSREGYARIARPYDVFEAAHQVIALVLPATGREVRVETDFQGDGLVECVPEEMHQVLTNLIQNAIEAVAEDGTGRVWVAGRRENSRVILSVRDNGPGIPAEVRERIFTPFFTTKGPGKGMGMGLTITWRVVRALGGAIKVNSTPGQGTEFVLTLPAAPNGSRAHSNGTPKNP